MKNKYDITCTAIASAPRYIEESDLLTDLLCSRYKVENTDKVTVKHIVKLALDAATSENFREKADFLMLQLDTS